MSPVAQDLAAVADGAALVDGDPLRLVGDVLAFLAANPFVLLFTVVALGTRLGRLQFGGFNPGSTALTLLTGITLSLVADVVYGIRYAMPALVTTVFLNLFMFAVGLKVGPKFFAGLKRDGAKGVSVALVVVGLNFAIVIAGAKLCSLPPGYAPGIVSGSMTDAAVVGVATAAIENGTYRPPAGTDAATVAGNVAAAYAVDYLFSLVGMVLLVRYLPRILRIDPKAAAREAEASYGSGSHLPGAGVEAAYAFERTAVDLRAYRIESDAAVGMTVGELSLRVEAPVLQVLRGDEALDLDADPRIQKGDVITVLTDVARLATVAPRAFGSEVGDDRVRRLPVEVADLVITRSGFVGLTLDEAARRLRLALAPVGQDVGRVFHPLALIRDGVPIAVRPELRIERGDILRVVGPSSRTREAGRILGSSVHLTTESDILTLSLGLAAGYVAGSVNVSIGAVPLHLGAPAGVMLSGIAISALRSRNPLFGGPVSEGARSLLQALGLDAFVASLAVNSAPAVVAAWNGGDVPVLLAIGLVASLLPPLAGWFVGHKVLGLNPAVLLGAICGARHSTPGLRVAQEETASAIPGTGYPVPYAISSVLVLLLGYLALFL